MSEFLVMPEELDTEGCLEREGGNEKATERERVFEFLVTEP